MICLAVISARASSSILHRQLRHFRLPWPGLGILGSSWAEEELFRAPSLAVVVLESSLTGEEILRAEEVLGVLGTLFTTAFFLLKGPKKPTGVSVSVSDAPLRSHRMRTMVTIVTTLSKICANASINAMGKKSNIDKVLAKAGNIAGFVPPITVRVSHHANDPPPQVSSKYEKFDPRQQGCCYNSHF